MAKNWIENPTPELIEKCRRKLDSNGAPMEGRMIHPDFDVEIIKEEIKKFDRKEVMKARWAKAKSEGKSSL